MISSRFHAALFVFVTIVGLPTSEAQQVASYTSPLPTGVRLDPVGDRVDLGSMPLGMAFAPGGRALAVLLSGWRQQGVQIVDLGSLRILQTLEQPAAFLGIAFSHDGNELFASGGNADAIFCYSWREGRATFEHKIDLAEKKPDKPAAHYPAGLASSRIGNYLYVAENMSDSLAVIDVAASKVVQRLPTDHYPYAVEVVSNDKLYVSAWGADALTEFKVKPDGLLVPTGKLKVGARPSALVANRSGTRLFVALAGVDRVAIVDAVEDRVLRYLSDAAPAGPSEGSTPNALALSTDESRLFVAEADNNAIAVFDVSAKQPQPGNRLMEGRLPTDWYPSAVLDAEGRLLVVSGKGQGTHPNPDGPTPGESIKRPLGYALGQLNGTLRALPDSISQDQLRQYSQRVAEANNWTVSRARERYPPFKHVIYIIKENRTYDQILGDLPEGDGDPALLFFGEDVAPNHHALARRFGLFDRFFTNAEVSSQGHIWSTAGCTTDFGEKLVPSAYSDRRGDVDGDPADEPLNGFLWTLARKKKITFRDYGEMVHAPEGWPVTQRDLGSDISPTYPTFNLKITDQVRADAWIAELRTFARDGKMPALEILHLPGDHTAGGRADYPTPKAYVADNDLALGRIVEALSTSPFWKDTVIFVLEDDSQAGPDHVDSHRSPFFAISAYSRPGTRHRFANTTDVVAAIEDILGLDRLCKFDYFSRSLAGVFAPTPDYAPWTALVPQQDRNEMNAPATAAARLSERLDFSAPDRVDETTFNQILWSMLKGTESPPPARTRAPLEVYQVSH